MASTLQIGLLLSLALLAPALAASLERGLIFNLVRGEKPVLAAARERGAWGAEVAAMLHLWRWPWGCPKVMAAPLRAKLTCSWGN